MSTHGPAVFVHGGPETSAVWFSLLEELDRDDVVCLSPPGFGAPLRDGFDVSLDGCLDWLVARLEEFRRPVDLVGHDYGALHVFNLAMNRPDLIRSWACDAIGVFHPDYEWHGLAQLVQTPGAGERFVEEKLQASLEEHIAGCRAWGVGEPLATRLAAGFDEHMWRAVLSLYRSAAQPALAKAGQKASAAAARPGLALFVTDDPLTGTYDMRHQVATEAGAEIAVLDDAGHWWMARQPAAGAAILNDFWARLP
ncbi:hypothetical protein OK074_3347 [Actinobacteria bacterium OK074]|nr:hypothetical protein OK074_3347 [Actinobacteria bacterium OK074]